MRIGIFGILWLLVVGCSNPMLATSASVSGGTGDTSDGGQGGTSGNGGDGGDTSSSGSGGSDSSCSTEGTLMTPVQEEIVIPAGEMVTRTIPLQQGRRYVMCTEPTAGEVFLYGDYTAFTRDTAAYKSELTGVADDGLPEPNCIWFDNCQIGDFQVGIHAHAMEAAITFWVVDSLLQEVPAGYVGQFLWPTPACEDLVNHYSPFNSPWGNDFEPHQYFFAGDIGAPGGHKGYLHGGVDVACPANTDVLSPCDGVVSRTPAGFLGTDDYSGESWGYYVRIICDSPVAVWGIDHLNDEGRQVNGERVLKGQKVGSIFPVRVPGEGEHLHLTLCKATYDECAAASQLPQKGADHYSRFPGLWINPWIRTNPGLWQE